MSPDLSNLNLKQESVEVDFDNYADAQEFPPPIPEGVYQFRQGKPTFEATKGGYLSALFNHTVVGGTEDGKEVRFDRVSTKPFERQGTKASMAADHLRAVGDTSRPKDAQEYAAAFEANEGKLFKAQVSWEWWDGETETAVKGASKASRLPNGEPNPTMKFGADGAIREVTARARITRRIPAGG